ncbi:MAG TPA: hypothetical protein VF435_19705, partial [Pyrinomonadaceae bacterium]
INKLPRMKASKREEILKELEDAKEELHSTFSKEITKYCEKYYSQPIVQTVALLPKEELATMAETLVNLTSFKRRVTLDTESVGGPVDVAIITKGDGFVWIKRKHYFEAGLNPHYFKHHI